MKVVTLACGDPGHAAVPRGLRDVVYVDGLCRSPGDLSRWIDGADRLVMILHRAERSLAKIQRSVRVAGIDPLGVEYLLADTIADDAQWAEVLIGGAAARAAAFVESRPEHARARFGGSRSRRDLLSVPQPYYEALPMIDETVCAAADGCRACVTECPQSAYRWSLGNVRFDRDDCVTCGRCLTACPTGAIGNPSIGNRALVDQITALVNGAAPDPLGIAFVCRGRTRGIGIDGWAEVEVPCTGMIPATWPVAAVLLGGVAAAVVPCSATGCGLGNDERASDAVTVARELIASAGLDPAVVLAEPGELTTSPIGPVVLDAPFGIHGPTEVALALQSIATTLHAVIGSGVTASRGVITIDPAMCTLCLACTETCPTGALFGKTSDGELEVTFDAALCTGCGQCVPACPELERGAIGIERRIDSGRLRAGPQRLAASATSECELCGAPVASAAMLSRISELLGDEHDATMNYLERRCTDCRGAA